MALTNAQKSKVLQLLGYPGASLLNTSVLYDKILVDRLTFIDADTESLVTGNLSQIATIEKQIALAPTRFIASEVGDIKLNDSEMAKLRKERRILSREIGALLNIDYLGGGGSMMVGVSV